MAIDWSHLPKDVISKVCMCAKKVGYSHDPESGYFVCANCRKPSILVGVKECDLCDKVFVPVKYDRYNALGVACSDCL
jgi:hypothetical protein